MRSLALLCLLQCILAVNAAEVTCTTHESSLSNRDEPLQRAGIRLVILGDLVEAPIPMTWRHRPVDGEALVTAVAAEAGLEVTWCAPAPGSRLRTAVLWSRVTDAELTAWQTTSSASGEVGCAALWQATALGDARCLPVIVAAARGDDAVRARWARALLRRLDWQAVLPLCPEAASLCREDTALKDDDLSGAALDALAAWSGTDAIPDLVPLLTDPDLPVQQRALSALGATAAAAAVPVLQQAAVNASPAKVEAVIDALGQLADPAAGDLLNEWLGARQTDRTNTVLWSLVQLGDARARPRLLELLWCHDPYLRASALTLLATLADAVDLDACARVLRCDTGYNAETILAVIANHPDPTATDLLAAVTDGMDPDQATAAIALLGRRRDPASLRLLLDLADPATYPGDTGGFNLFGEGQPRDAAITALTKRPEPAAREFLLQALDGLPPERQRLLMQAFLAAADATILPEMTARFASATDLALRSAVARVICRYAAGRADRDPTTVLPALAGEDLDDLGDHLLGSNRLRAVDHLATRLAVVDTDQATLRALIRCGGMPSEATLAAAMTRPLTAERRDLVWALIEHGGPAVVTALQRLAGDGMVKVRYPALTALIAMGGAEAAWAREQARTDPWPDIRCLATSDGAIQPDDQEPWDLSAGTFTARIRWREERWRPAADLVLAALDAGDPALRIQALDHLEHLDEATALARLRVALADPDPQIRITAIPRVVEWFDVLTVEQVEQLLADPADDIRLAARPLLALLPPGSQAAGIHRSLIDPARNCVSWELWGLPKDSLSQAVDQASQNADWEFRSLALDCAIDLVLPVRTVILRRALADPALPDIRAAALGQAYEFLPLEDCLAACDRLTSDPDEGVKDAAAKLLWCLRDVRTAPIWRRIATQPHHPAHENVLFGLAMTGEAGCLDLVDRSIKANAGDVPTGLADCLLPIDTDWCFGRPGPAPVDPVLKAQQDDLTRRLLDHAHPAVRRQMFPVAVRRGLWDVTELSRRFLAAEDPEDREALLSAIPNDPDPAKMALIGRGLVDPDPDVRKTAIGFLAYQETEEAFALLRTMATDPDATVRRQVVCTLGGGDWSGPDWLDLAETFLHDNDQVVCSSAWANWTRRYCQGWSGLGDTIIRALADPDRNRASMVLTKLMDQAWCDKDCAAMAVAALRTEAAAPDPRRRADAARALGGLIKAEDVWDPLASLAADTVIAVRFGVIGGLFPDHRSSIDPVDAAKAINLLLPLARNERLDQREAAVKNILAWLDAGAKPAVITMDLFRLPDAKDRRMVADWLTTRADVTDWLDAVMDAWIQETDATTKQVLEGILRQHSGTNPTIRRLLRDDGAIDL